MIDIPDLLLNLVAIANLIFLLLLFFAEKATPSKILLWAILFLILPIIGFILYIFIGQTFYAQHTFKIKSITDEQISESTEYVKKLISDEQNPEYKEMADSMLKLCGEGYTSNNNVKLYTLGQDKFDDLYADLRAAKESIHLEYYIIRDDELGNELMDILVDKVKEGVSVKLLTDAFGVGKGPKKGIKKFKAAGGEFAAFHSVAALLLSPKKNNRNHRKIAVIDGTIGYCGGFNIGDEYLGKGPLGFWRDTAVRVEGMSCYALQVRFYMDWCYANKIDHKINSFDYPDEPSFVKGNTGIVAISGGPDVSMFNPVRLEYLTLINKAKKSIYIHSPYFILDDSLTDALKLAAGRGVDVKIIIPDKPDHPFVFWNNVRCSYFLMGNGIKVYMYNRGFVHSKTIVVDGEYCSVGSANFDDRSLVLNFETNLMIFSKDIGSQMDAAFEEDLKYCTEYTKETYDSYGLWTYFKIAFSRLFGNLA